MFSWINLLILNGLLIFVYFRYEVWSRLWVNLLSWSRVVALFRNFVWLNFWPFDVLLLVYSLIRIELVKLTMC